MTPPDRCWAAVTDAADLALVRFNQWFSSRGGVWQTLLATLLIVIAERVFPQLDPNGFWLLYCLTIYSGITQPALACVGRESADQLERMQRDHASLLQAIHDLTAQQNRMLASIQTTVEHEEVEMAELLGEHAPLAPQAGARA